MNIGTVLFHNVSDVEVALMHSLLHDAASYASQAQDPPAQATEIPDLTPDLTPDQLTPAHQVFTVAKSRHSVQTQHKLTLTPTWAFAGAPPIDVLIVPSGVTLPVRDGVLVSYLQDAARAARYVLAIGSGVALLGAGGMLTGLEVTAVAGLHDYLESCEVRAVRSEPVVMNPARAAAPALWCVLGGGYVLEVSLRLAEELFSANAAAAVRSRYYLQALAGE